ncbi:alpha/beta hydrolase [Marinobacter zhejiangensis]|uniref:Acetyl esterase/lipase n=1 Tax=Marinobacter zhejiangensis TaxID=488535 RepID=A0A1I4QFN2_9GAMM|nr:alpha/beta hydrolase [Marinobacter zhejiangensis]SFM38545.1 Acetyl esterase/lipase [Marinobacter zhejiangensis]
MLQSALATGLRQTMQRLVKPVLSPLVPIPVQRTLTRQAYRSSIPPRGCRFENTRLGGVPTVKASYGKPGKRAVLYFHGGAYIIGSPQTHQGLTGHLAKASGAVVYTPDYRLAPENPYPAALDDAVATYRALLDQGYQPEHIAIAGDSAGGGLTLALAMRLRDEQLPQPTSLTLFSPWTDLTHSELAAPASEPVIPQAWIDKAASLYRGNEPLTSPYISPIYGDLSGLPPMLIQVGSEEILLNDSERLAAKARRQGAQVQLEVYNSLWHVFQVHAGQLARATDAVQTAGEHIRRCMAL